MMLYCRGRGLNEHLSPQHATLRIAKCGECGNRWCEACDPAPSALCHWCHGRGYSTAPIGQHERIT